MPQFSHHSAKHKPFSSFWHIFEIITGIKASRADRCAYPACLRCESQRLCPCWLLTPERRLWRNPPISPPATHRLWNLHWQTERWNLSPSRLSLPCNVLRFLWYPGLNKVQQIHPSLRLNPARTSQSSEKEGIKERQPWFPKPTHFHLKILLVMVCSAPGEQLWTSLLHMHSFFLPSSQSRHQ